MRSRLTALEYGQKDLARAARVTDSYVSQLLTRRKSPPAPERTDIYGKMEALLQLKPGELERLVEIERADELKRKLALAPQPLFRGFRDLFWASALLSDAPKSAPSSSESRSASWKESSRSPC